MPEITRSQYAVLTGLGFSIVASMLLLAAVILRGQARDAEAREEERRRVPVGAAPSPAGEPLREAPPATVGRRSAEPADLLALVDADEDAVTGSWTRDGRSIVSPKLPFARLQLPYQPPAEYELALTVTRLEGKDSFNVGITTPGRQACLVLDGTEEGGLSGLDQVGGKWFRDNETSYKGGIFRPLTPTRVLVSVRKAAFRVSIDDRLIIDWKNPDYTKLSLYREWSVWTRRAIFIGSHESSFRIDEIRVSPLGSEGYLAR